MATQFKTAWQRHDLNVHVRLSDLDTVVPAKIGRASVSGGADAEVGIAGTPGYMAPEAYVGLPTFAGDLFSVGVMLYQIIRCACPLHEAAFQILRGERLDEVSEETRHQLAKAVSDRCRAINWTEDPWPSLPRCRDFCMQLMDPHPAKRGDDAAQLLENSAWLNPHVSRKVREAVLLKQAQAREAEEEKLHMATARGSARASLGTARGSTGRVSSGLNTTSGSTSGSSPRVSSGLRSARASDGLGTARESGYKSAQASVTAKSPSRSSHQSAQVAVSHV